MRIEAITIFPEYEDVVRSVPIDRILPETDAPFAAPLPYRGKRNHPEYVTEVVKKIAEIKQIPFEKLQEQLCLILNIGSMPFIH